MVLLYDHVLTFGDEVQYVWSAPATYAKYIFLLNRYVVLGTLLAVAYGEQNSIVWKHMFQLCSTEMCGFVDSTFTDAVCPASILTWGA